MTETTTTAELYDMLALHECLILRLPIAEVPKLKRRLIKRRYMIGLEVGKEFKDSRRLHFDVTDLGDGSARLCINLVGRSPSLTLLCPIELGVDL